MKNILIIILLVAFGVGLYVNFGMDQDIDQSEIISGETENDTDESETGTAASSEEPAEEAGTMETVEDDTVTFSQASLQEIYTERLEASEPLLIDVLLPSYYTDEFINKLTTQFGTDTVEFNRVDIDTNTVNLSELTVNENSDAVLIDALQIRDYNDEVLPDREVDHLTNAYMSIYDSGKTVYILGNPNVHQHENLADVLAADQESLVDNDYYYIDNQEVSVDGGYYDEAADEMTAAVEEAVAQNIHGYMVE